MTERYKTLGQTTLAEDLDSSEPAVDVTSAAALRDSYTTGDTYVIKVDNEIMTVTAESGNTLTVTRGAEGTTAAGHSTGTTVKSSLYTARAITQIKADANIIGTSGNVGTNILASAYSITGSSYQGCGVTAVLPSSGRYILLGNVTGYILNSSGASNITAKVRNVTDASDLTGVYLVVDSDNTDNEHGSVGIFYGPFTVAATKTFEIYVARATTGAFSVSQVQIGTSLMFIKISD